MTDGEGRIVPGDHLSSTAAPESGFRYTYENRAIFVTDMARPKSDDPTVPVMFRMKRSAWQWWVEEGERRDVKPQKLIQQNAEQKAATARSVRTRNVDSLAREDVEPRLKKVKQ